MEHSARITKTIQFVKFAEFLVCPTQREIGENHGFLLTLQLKVNDIKKINN